MNSEIIKLISHKIKAIEDKYSLINKVTANNYNIFTVLGIERKEVITHSKFIADLLNPNGQHMCDDLFLKDFTNIIGLNKPYKTNNYHVITEMNLGSINIENNTGGSIDIFIGNNDEDPILIENKIHAGDQENQLLRYNNSFNGKCHLLYLTLFGHEPSDYSKGDKKLKFKTISYSYHILKWLENCYSLTIEKPVLRETIKQYINVVKMLTHQNENYMEDEIHKLIKNNIVEFQEIKKQLDSYSVHLSNLLNELFIDINQLCNKRGIVISKSENTTWQGSHLIKFQIEGIWYQIVINNLKMVDHYWTEDSSHILELDKKIGTIDFTESQEIISNKIVDLLQFITNLTRKE